MGDKPMSAPQVQKETKPQTLTFDYLGYPIEVPADTEGVVIVEGLRFIIFDRNDKVIVGSLHDYVIKYNTSTREILIPGLYTAKPAHLFIRRGY